MKQDIENQYDDDLTLGTDEYDDSYYTDADDLFEFSTNDESPISRLKSLVLSIDWEITDEVLLQFNEELIDLKGIWAGNSINLVYVQALEKISKYIYQNKANSHPNSIKLLLTLYYNLEKIVSSEDLSEAQKKEILLEDVKKFEGLKRQISQKTKPSSPISPPARSQVAKVKKDESTEDKLLNLKAIVLGIDWEITDQELNNLRREVLHLEEQFASSRPKLILLQGIGTLGAYIKTKKSNAHADAFKVLHLFYESLEKIVKSSMSLEEEKAILFPAVEKFNDFKSLIGPTISPEAIEREEDEDDDEDLEESVSGEIAPALADVSDEETIGFQADEEAKSLGIDNTTAGVSSQIDSFFGESVSLADEGDDYLTAGAAGDLLTKEKSSFLGIDNANVTPSVEREMALQGVDVEADDEEEDEDHVPGVAALADVDDDAVSDWKETSADAGRGVTLAMDDKNPASLASDEEIARATDSLFADTEIPSREIEQSRVDREIALQGVNVETEADEDSDEISLPREGEGIAPALVASEEESLFSAETLESKVAEGIGEEIAGTLDDLFLEEEQVSFTEPEKSNEEAFEETEAGSFHVEEQSAVEEPAGEIDAEHIDVPADDRQPEFSDAVVASEDDAIVTVQEEVTAQEEEDLSLFFTGSDLEQSAEESGAVDSLFESLEPALFEEPVSAGSGEQAQPILGQEDLTEESGLESAAVEVDEVTSAEEISFLEEEASPIVDTEEKIIPIEDEATPVEEEIQLFDKSIQHAEDEIRVDSPDAEEELFPIEEPPAEEEMLSFNDEDFSAGEEIALKEEISPVDEDNAGEDVLVAGEDVAATVEDVSLAEADSSLDQELSPVVDILPDQEELSLDEEVLSTEENLDVQLDPEEPSFVAAKAPIEGFLEEAVVFELADEAETEAVPVAPATPPLNENEFIFADEVAEGLPAAFLEPVADEDTLSFVEAESGSNNFLNAPLANLHDCIQSLGIELNDGILSGLFQEINALRQKWSNRPLEKTFLQLLSTIAQHVDSYRFEASSEAHNLLLSVYAALADIREDDVQYCQELLLVETHKVLEWQQGMLTRQAVQKGTQLTFTAPVRSEGEDVESVVDARQDFDQLLQQYEEPVEEASFSSADELLGATTEHRVDFSRESLATELKQEIASLRMTLQQEIAELRSELKSK